MVKNTILGIDKSCFIADRQCKGAKNEPGSIQQQTYS